MRPYHAPAHCPAPIAWPGRLGPFCRALFIAMLHSCTPHHSRSLHDDTVQLAVVLLARPPGIHGQTHVHSQHHPAHTSSSPAWIPAPGAPFASTSTTMDSVCTSPCTTTSLPILFHSRPSSALTSTPPHHVPSKNAVNRTVPRSPMSPPAYTQAEQPTFLPPEIFKSVCESVIVDAFVLLLSPWNMYAPECALGKDNAFRTERLAQEPVAEQVQGATKADSNDGLVMAFVHARVFGGETLHGGAASTERSMLRPKSEGRADVTELMYAITLPRARTESSERAQGARISTAEPETLPRLWNRT